MTDQPSVGALAIVPCNHLPSARSFWERIGFEVTGDFGEYLILEGWGCEVHLQPSGEGNFRVPENNPFGVFLRTPEVDAIAARVGDLIIRPGGTPSHREWSMYELAVNGPDNLLVRVGWPSRLFKEAA